MFSDYGDLLSANEVCEILDIGHNLIYDLLGSGKLKGFRCGKSWKIPKESLVQFIRENTENPKAAEG